MAKRVAFCLVENNIGQVLLIQRGYGKEKFKWSLPGGHCDGQEDYHQAARREMREETDLRVEIISLIFEGRSHPIKTYFGRIKGGHLRAKRPECLDAKFFDYDRLPPLAFSADHRAIRDWRDMKANHTQLTSNSQTPPCPNCGSGQTNLRHYPHHNPYRCQSCNKVFQSAMSMAQDKSTPITDIIIDYIHSERERLGLLVLVPDSALLAAAHPRHEPVEPDAQQATGMIGGRPQRFAFHVHSQLSPFSIRQSVNERCNKACRVIAGEQVVQRGRQ